MDNVDATMQDDTSNHVVSTHQLVDLMVTAQTMFEDRDPREVDAWRQVVDEWKADHASKDLDGRIDNMSDNTKRLMETIFPLAKARFATMRYGDPATCRRCGRQAWQRSNDGKWVHLDASGHEIRGCRAATFTTGGGWDRSIPSSWQAIA